MNKIPSLLMLLTMLSASLNISAQEKVFSAYLSKAGMLSSMLPTDDAIRILELKLSGHMDARDFDYIKWHCSRVQMVDLSDVMIDAYEGEDGTNEGYDDIYLTNEIPTGAFYFWGTSKKYQYSGMPKNEGMSSIIRVILPKGTESIGSKAFADMPKIESLTILAEYPPKVHESSFTRLPKGAKLYVPQGTKARYLKAKGWEEFRDIVEVNEKGVLLLTDSPLVGTWKTTRIEGLEDSFKIPKIDYLQLNPDWTYTRVEEKDGEPYVTRGKWSLTEGRFTLYKDNDAQEEDSFNYKIIEINRDKMKVRMLRITEYMEKVKDSIIKQYDKK